MSIPKIVLITGTSSGIGLSTALAFARNGDQVYATMRNLDKAAPLLEQARASGLPLDVLALDVENAASIQTVVEQLISQHGRIDILVNNAGAGYLGTTEQTSMDDVRRVFEVNFFGTWQVTQAVIPHMRAARSGHIISVSSIGGLVGQPFNVAYCAAKFAVEGMMESLAPVLQRFGVHVTLVEPGAVNMEFVANVGVAFGLPTGTTDPYTPMLTSYLSGTEAAYAGAQTGDDVAEVLVAVAADAAPHLKYQSSDSIRGRDRLLRRVVPHTSPLSVSSARGRSRSSCHGADLST